MESGTAVGENDGTAVDGGLFQYQASPVGLEDGGEVPRQLHEYIEGEAEGWLEYDGMGLGALEGIDVCKGFAVFGSIGCAEGAEVGVSEGEGGSWATLVG